MNIMNTTNSDKYDFYDELMSNKGYYIALKENKYGIVDRQGKIIVPFMYEEYADDAENGLITVSLNGKFGIIDLNNNIIIPFEYEVIRNYLPENIVAKRNGKYGLINLKNEIVSDFMYGDLFKVKGYDNYIAKLDSKWGIVDKNLNHVEPFVYDDWEITYNESIHLTNINGQSLEIKLSDNQLTEELNQSLNDMAQIGQTFNDNHKVWVVSAENNAHYFKGNQVIFKFKKPEICPKTLEDIKELEVFKSSVCTDEELNILVDWFSRNYITLNGKVIKRQTNFERLEDEFESQNAVINKK